MNRKRRLLRAALLAAGLLAWSGLAGDAQGQEAATDGGGSSGPQTLQEYYESLDVRLVTVPFYAVDATGAPVYDLRMDELELSIGGERVPVEILDRSETPASETIESYQTERKEDVLDAPLESLEGLGKPRHVFLLVDQAFATPRGLRANLDAAKDILGDLPAKDWLYLLTYHTQNGFEQHVGPLTATVDGKAQVDSLIGGLRPNIERIERQTDVQPIARGRFEGGNVDSAYIDMHQMVKSEYRAAAGGLASGLDTLATFMRQVQGPKLLLYFTQGIDSRLYTDGLGNRVAPIREAFAQPLERLSETGALLVYINAATHTEAGIGEGTVFDHEADATFINDLARGDSSLEEMREVSGGQVFSHTNVRRLAHRVTNWTSAYYEAAFHGSAARRQGEIELRSLRPGVEIWTPKTVRNSKPYAEMDGQEKRFLVADLVMRGPEAFAAQEVHLPTFLRLSGNFRPGKKDRAGHLEFLAQWPQDVLFRSLELYSVVLEPGAEHLRDSRLVRFDQQLISPVGEGPALSVELPAGSERRIWGIVAVEPDTGRFFVRRTVVAPERVGATQAAARVPRG